MEDLMDEDEKDRAKRYQPLFTHEHLPVSTCFFVYVYSWKRTAPLQQNAYQSFREMLATIHLIV